MNCKLTYKRLNDWIPELDIKNDWRYEEVMEDIFDWQAESTLKEIQLDDTSNDDGGAENGFTVYWFFSLIRKLGV